MPRWLIVGFGFIQHGWAKLMRGPEVFITILHAIGMSWPHVLSRATIVVELTGGTLMLLGAFVPAVTVPMLVVLRVAIFTVHLP